MVGVGVDGKAGFFSSEFPVLGDGCGWIGLISSFLPAPKEVTTQVSLRVTRFGATGHFVSSRCQFAEVPKEVVVGEGLSFVR